MKIILVFESILVVILGAHGWLLFNKTPTFVEQREQLYVQKNMRLRFKHATGISVLGDRITLGGDPGRARVAAFLLREASLAADLEFWQGVQRLLPPGSDAAVLAYCDGAACVSAVRPVAASLSFPVLAFGEVSGSQAVLNADAQGAFVMTNAVGPLTWRSGQRAADIVKAMMQ